MPDAAELYLDVLTALPNRRWIVSVLPEHFARLRSSGRSLSLVLADVDGFGGVVEAVGQASADEVLAAVAGKLAAGAGSDAVVARYAGDEFLVLLPDTEEFFARMAAEEMAGAVSAGVRSARGGVTVSVGVASCPRDAEGLSELFAAAKDALHLAKRRGRGSVATAEDVASAKPVELDPFSRFPCPRMVGRSREMDFVRRAAASVAPGRPALVLVTGPGGSGKTRLLGELSRTLAAAGTTVMSTAGARGGELAPFSLAAGLLSGFMRAHSGSPEAVFRTLQPGEAAVAAEILPSLAHLAPEAPSPPDPAARSALANAGLVAMMEGSCRGRSLALVIDDFESADAQSLDVISSLGRSQEVSLFVAAALSRGQSPPDASPLAAWLARQAELGRSLARVELGPMPLADVSGLIDAALPCRPADAAADARAFEATGGLPLAVEELLKVLLARVAEGSSGAALSGAAAALAQPGLPRGLQSIVEARLASWAEPVREAACACAAAGGWALASELERLTGRREGEVLEAAERLLREGVLRPALGPDGVGFEFYSPELAVQVASRATPEMIADVRRMLREKLGASGATDELLELVPRLAAVGEASAAARLSGELAVRADGLWGREPAPQAVPAEVTGAPAPAGRTAAPAQAKAPAGPPRAAAPAERRARPKVSTSELSDAAKSKMKGLCEKFVAAVREAKNASPRDTATMRAVGDLISAFEEVLREVGVLTFSARQNAMRANGCLLGVRPYGDAPALVGGILRRKGIDVISIDPAVKLDELVRIVHALSQDTAPVSRTEDYEKFLDGEEIHHISIEPAKLMPKDTRVPYLPEPPEEKRLRAGAARPADVPEAAPAATAAIPKGPPAIIFDEPLAPAAGEATITARHAASDSYARRGRRRAVFETHVDLLPAGLGTPAIRAPQAAAPALRSAGTGSAAAEGIPPGDGPVILTEELERTLPAVIRDLVAANETEEASGLVKRLLAGTTSGDADGRRRLANFLLRGIDLFVRIPDPGVEKALERTLAKEIAFEQDPGTAELLAACARECIVHFVGTGRFHSAAHLARALASAPAREARSVLEGLARTDVFEALMADLKSGEAARIQNAAVVLVSMGQYSRRPLLEIVKSSDDYRIRSAAAFVLHEVMAGDDAGVAELVAAMGPAGGAAERARIISVADTLGFDQASVALAAIQEGDAEVRSAGMKLVRRLDAAAQTALARALASGGTDEALAEAFDLVGELVLPAGFEILAEHLPSHARAGGLAAGARALGRLARAPGISAQNAVRLLEMLLTKCLAIMTPEMTPVAVETLKALACYDAPEALAAIRSSVSYPVREVAEVARRLADGRTGK